MDRETHFNLQGLPIYGVCRIQSDEHNGIGPKGCIRSLLDRQRSLRAGLLDGDHENASNLSVRQVHRDTAWKTWTHLALNHPDTFLNARLEP